MSALQNKVAIITGASSGIGRAAAGLFAREGARVVVGARREAELEALAAEITAAGGEAIALPGDVRDREGDGPRHCRLFSGRDGDVTLTGAERAALAGGLIRGHSWPRCSEATSPGSPRCAGHDEEDEVRAQSLDEEDEVRPQSLVPNLSFGAQSLVRHVRSVPNLSFGTFSAEGENEGCILEGAPGETFFVVVFAFTDAEFEIVATAR
jgi:hypothetical protein